MKTCKNCGFLALRDKHTRELGEADEGYRELLDLRSGPSPFPVCFVSAVNLRFEIDAPTQEAIMEVIVFKDRSDCPGWTPWQQGFTPKEHREMLDRKEEREWNRALVETLEDTRARREGLHLLVTVIVAGILLFIATLAAPTLAVWVENRFLGGG